MYLKKPSTNPQNPLIQEIHNAHCSVWDTSADGKGSSFCYTGPQSNRCLGHNKCREVVLAVQIATYLSGHQGMDFDSAFHKLSLQPIEALPSILNVCCIRNLSLKQNARGDNSKLLNIPKFLMFANYPFLHWYCYSIYFGGQQYTRGLGDDFV